MQAQQENDPEPVIQPTRWEGWVASILMIALCGVIFLQILGRFGFFPGRVWTEELTRWLWVWLALLGCAATEAHGQHLRMEILTSFWSSKTQFISEKLQQVVALATVLFLTWLGYKGVLRTWYNESVTLPVSDAVLYAALPIAMLLWAHRIIHRLIAP
ncbi:TRAP transporter small permease [Betaproteobacteria bacterium LSUCC0117]|nr:TRAP transporter small permease [Betaproteobacteria bacterium LSUCC0117]